MRRAWSHVLAWTAMIFILAGCSGSGSNGGSGAITSASGAVPAPSATATPIYNPQKAAIIFVNGGAGAAEIFTGPPGQLPTNLWPGIADRGLLNWSLNFPALAQINTRDASGRIVSHTTSSENYPVGCGSTPFGNGTVAQYEPYALQPTWYLPEKRGDEFGPFPSPPLELAQTNYNDFGYGLLQQVQADGRGQMVVFYAWDWRRFPGDQVAAFHQRVVQLTQQTGCKVTVVAHSEGNLFFRAWIEYVEGRGEKAGTYCGRFLSVAAPWWGVATAWEHLAYGTIQPGVASDILSSRIGRDNVKQVFDSGGGTFVLLPTQAFQDYITTTLGRTGESWLAIPKGAVGSQWVPYPQIVDAVTLQANLCPQSNTFPCLGAQLYQAAAARFPKPGFNTSGIQDWVGIVSSGVKTAIQQCSGADVWPDGSTDGDFINADGAGNPMLAHRTRYVSGDLNVPVFSAIQGTDPQNPPGDKVPFYFAYNITHLDLMINADVLAQTIPYAAGDRPLSYGGVFHTTPLTTITPSDQ